MAQYAEVNGVRTWYDVQGEGEPLVLMHGGLSNAGEFHGNLLDLTSRFTTYLPERRGHGHTPDVEGPLTIGVQVEDAIAFLDEVVGGGPVRLAGYSMGASVALGVAMARPDLVERLVLISGCYDLAGLLFSPADGDGSFVPDIIKDMYGAVSPDGREHIHVVAAKLSEAARTEKPWTTDDLAGVRARTLIVSGDDDLVTLEHTLSMYRAIPDAELSVIPRASHVLFLDRPELYTRTVEEFLTREPNPTIMPIARGGS
ncbi:oxidoreductase [Actinorhabdospora filicis]|uniref:Oxidoreductase n=1 Tax=Actinorhabdospora filicis TaxID=1785913 RepID=A0A9W6WCE6_9ACTN|nr:alpha/beta hydrolase [Actinorhabdospora filicis]GLZ79700.1 oxidoreductase [Actinorhabdospora filicis]